jgi:hypothetical protein
VMVARWGFGRDHVVDHKGSEVPRRLMASQREAHAGGILHGAGEGVVEGVDAGAWARSCH